MYNAAAHRGIDRTEDVMARARATKKISKRKPRKRTGPKGTCFTITPFGGWFDDYYTTIFVPAIEEAGLEACRADDLYRPSTIVADIWDYTNKARLVLADLSGKNPNVFYELGLAHALAKPAILVVESIDDVPFDLRALRVLQYDKNEASWGTVLHDKIVKSIREVLANPAQSVPSAFIEVEAKRGVPTVTEQEKELLAIRQELDLLRREVRVGAPSTEDLVYSPELAQSEIERLLSRGYPKAIIKHRLVRRGVPAAWLDQALREMSARTVRPVSAVRTTSKKDRVGKAAGKRSGEREAPKAAKRKAAKRKATK